MTDEDEASTSGCVKGGLGIAIEKSELEGETFRYIYVGPHFKKGKKKRKFGPSLPMVAGPVMEARPLQMVPASNCQPQVQMDVQINGVKEDGALARRD